MTTNQIKLDCGATVVTEKVCGRYYIKAVQDCTNKGILTPGLPYRTIREVRKFMIEKVSEFDWTKRLRKSEINERLNWYQDTMKHLRVLSCR